MGVLNETRPIAPTTPSQFKLYHVNVFEWERIKLISKRNTYYVSFIFYYRGKYIVFVFSKYYARNVIN